MIMDYLEGRMQCDDDFMDYGEEFVSSIIKDINKCELNSQYDIGYYDRANEILI